MFQAGIGEGSKYGWSALESKEDLINVSNSGQGEVGDGAGDRAM